jgi:hypothetical protein
MRIIVRKKPKKPKEFTDAEILDRVLYWVLAAVPTGYINGDKYFSGIPLTDHTARFSVTKDLKRAVVEKMRADYENGSVNGAKE